MALFLCMQSNSYHLVDVFVAILLTNADPSSQPEQPVLPRICIIKLGRKRKYKEKETCLKKEDREERKRRKAISFAYPPMCQSFLRVLSPPRNMQNICFRIPVLQMSKVGSRELHSLPKVTQLTVAELGVRFKTPSSLQFRAPCLQVSLSCENHLPPWRWAGSEGPSYE